MYRFLLAFVSFLLVFEARTQDFKKRYAFAKSYFGVDFNYVPSFGESYYLDANKTLASFQRNAFISPAINLAASHFWGYTDFYVSINTSAIKLERDKVANVLNLGAATGLRLYPMPLKENQIRPFLGYKFSPITYAQVQSNQVHSQTNTKSIVDLGIGIRKPRFYAYAAYNKILKPELETFVSRTRKETTTFPANYVNFGLNWSIETTKGNDNAKTKQVHQLLDTTNVAGFFFGIGPSSVFPLVNSTYISDLRPYLNNKEIVGIFPDFSLGYHFTKKDFIISAAFRPIVQNRNGLGFAQKVDRKSLALEGYKFLTDYHGFAPYIGGGISLENIKITESDLGKSISDIANKKLTPIITAGWDIRPSRKSDVWLLKTNLRYAPLLKSTIDQKTLSLQHLEFNYIQFVMYPGRIKLYKQN